MFAVHDSNQMYPDTFSIRASAILTYLYSFMGDMVSRTWYVCVSRLCGYPSLCQRRRVRSVPACPIECAVNGGRVIATCLCQLTFAEFDIVDNLAIVMDVSCPPGQVPRVRENFGAILASLHRARVNGYTRGETFMR